MSTSKALLAAAVLSASVSAIGDTFTVNCNPLTTRRVDPVLSFGNPTSDHVHAVVGGTAFGPSTTNQNAINSRATTCDKILDNSIYWSPQLYHINSDGRYELVTHKGTAVYYQNRACDYQAGRTTCPSIQTNFAAAPPAGLRMISGNKDLRTFDKNDITQRAVNHHCLGAVDEETNSLPIRLCDTIRSQVTFPPCWDGVNLDSANHKSHMAFPEHGDYNGGVCPQSHPHAIMQLFFEFHFDTKKYTDRNFTFAQGDKTGYGFHGDFINGWKDLTRLGNAHRTCTDAQGVNSPTCSLNVGSDGSPGHASNQTPEIPAPAEEVGLNGPLAALPNNKIPTGDTPHAKLSSRVFPSDY
ncbi:putative wsc domain-containing protein [Rosellinia necatrix]|uniref:Putative wsc domain-containing protein n=1 Tax=Rosellinia necatrix TaxID=77044 RepID=A0A1S7UHV8_ROSNE|nr:putative wsc domain-containing protein [Rosellinia necatrix]